MGRVCVFDVNETLLDLRALGPRFARVFGDAAEGYAWRCTVRSILRPWECSG